MTVLELRLFAEQSRLDGAKPIVKSPLLVMLLNASKVVREPSLECVAVVRVRAGKQTASIRNSLRTTWLYLTRGFRQQIPMGCSLLRFSVRATGCRHFAVSGDETREAGAATPNVACETLSIEPNATSHAMIMNTVIISKSSC
jgi:hypothetical protein